MDVNNKETKLTTMHVIIIYDLGFFDTHLFVIFTFLRQAMRVIKNFFL